MREHEVRILAVNPHQIHARLTQAGAAVTPRRTIVTKSYTFPHQTFAGDVWARLRHDPAKGGAWELSLKRRAAGEHTVAEEISLGVTDADAAEKLLGLLGAVLRREITKDRATYVLRDVRFDLEVFSLIPPYLEIEGPTQEAVEWGLTVTGYTPADVFRGESVFHHYGVDTILRVT